jgi:hypothetical protein
LAAELTVRHSDRFSLSSATRSVLAVVAVDERGTRPLLRENGGGTGDSDGLAERPDRRDGSTDRFSSEDCKTDAVTTQRRQRFVRAQTAWMVAAIVVLTLLGALTLELFFVVSLIGLLVVVELTAPFAVTPRWRARLRWVIVLGLVGFGYVVFKRILDILPPGVVP